MSTQNSSTSPQPQSDRTSLPKWIAILFIVILTVVGIPLAIQHSTKQAAEQTRLDAEHNAAVTERWERIDTACDAKVREVLAEHGREDTEEERDRISCYVTTQLGSGHEDDPIEPDDVTVHYREPAAPGREVLAEYDGDIEKVVYTSEEGPDMVCLVRPIEGIGDEILACGGQPAP